MAGFERQLVPLEVTRAFATSDVRDANERLVVSEVLKQRPAATRTSISRATGLTTTTVATVLSKLVDSGFVDEARGQSTGGKPPIEVCWNDKARQIVVVDVSQSAGAITDLRGRQVFRSDWPDGYGRGVGALSQIVMHIGELLRHATEPIVGIGLAIPGVVRHDDKMVIESFALDWHREKVAEHVQLEFGMPVAMINDTQACAVAEYWLAEKRIESFATVRVDEGVGAGIVLGGQLFGSSGSSAGEIGHLVIEADGARCECGNRGCVETLLAEPRIIDRLVAVDPGLSEVRDKGSRAFFEQAAIRSRVDDALRQEIEVIGSNLGAAIAPLVGLLEVERVYIIGAVEALGTPVLDAVSRNVCRRALPALALGVDICFSELGDSAPLVGAAATVFHSSFGTL